MITKTTKFKLKYGFLLGLLISVSLQAGLLSRVPLSTKQEQLMRVIKTGIENILKGSCTLEEALKEAKKIDPKIADLIEKLIKYILEEVEKNPSLLEDTPQNKEIMTSKITAFCTKTLNPIQFGKNAALLDRLKDEFTPQQFKAFLDHTRSCVEQEVDQKNGSEAINQVENHKDITPTKPSETFTDYFSEENDKAILAATFGVRR